jgi:DNA mismatch repair ATPase MutS
MGAPVCASKFVSFPSGLFTSMRTTDSLQNNESYFFSELKRLKSLFDLASEKRPIFFLLDEILKGTNSKDKTSGSQAVIARLVDLRGTGLIATHDLTLSRMEKIFPGKVFNKCFEAEIVGEKLTFDYKLVSGVSRNMNATFLMKKMGIIKEKDTTS